MDCTLLLDANKGSLDGSKRPLDAPKGPLDAPKCPLNGSKCSLDGPKHPLDGPKCPLDAPKRPLDAPKRPLDGPKCPLARPNACKLLQRSFQAWDEGKIIHCPTPLTPLYAPIIDLTPMTTRQRPFSMSYSGELGVARAH